MLHSTIFRIGVKRPRCEIGENNTTVSIMHCSETLIEHPRTGDSNNRGSTCFSIDRVCNVHVNYYTTWLFIDSIHFARIKANISTLYLTIMSVINNIKYGL